MNRLKFQGLFSKKNIFLNELWGIADPYTLTLKAPIRTAADDTFKYIFFFSYKIILDILCESYAKQTIHMEFQGLFSKKKYFFKVSSAAIFAWRFKG